MLSPITPNSWLSVFLQLANVKSMKTPSENFLTPAYSQQDFIKAIQVARKNDRHRTLESEFVLVNGSLHDGYWIIAVS